MVLTPLQTLLMIAAVALGAILARFLPFVLFPDGREAPPFVTFLGKVLPAAMMGLLVVYCLKGVSFLRPPFGIPELAASAAVVGLQLRTRKPLLSIVVGTAIYMILLQEVFR
jgi:branched-subunit amino acid transport protein AzlD